MRWSLNNENFRMREYLVLLFGLDICMEVRAEDKW